MKRPSKSQKNLIVTVITLTLVFLFVRSILIKNPGDEIDNYKGIAVYYNGTNINNSHGSNYSSDGYYFGEKWQCVEFARRFFYGVKGHEMPDILGNANDYFDPAVAHGKINYRRGLIQYQNGGDMKPQVDDLLVFNNTSYGHLALITKIDTNSIEIVQQNANRQTRQKLNFICQNGHYLIDDPRPVGWLRYQRE